MLILTTLACQWGGPWFGQEGGSYRLTPFQSTQVYSYERPIGTPVAPDYALLEDILVKLYEEVNPGVVSIRVETPQGLGQGSGFVLSQDGHLLTNLHVVEDAAKVEVDFPSGLKTYGEVIGRDPDSDLGVIKVEVPSEQLWPLTLGDSDQVKIGQTVIAIGNPFGFNGTMTVGIVSGKGRTLDSLRSSPEGGYFTAGDIIQTDAAINPGNSGGPLLNLQGEVIGINRAIHTTAFTIMGDPVNSGIGFAASINIAKRVVPSLISQGKYDYPYLGVEGMTEITLAIQEEYKLPQPYGVYVTNVSADGPAKKAGVKQGDLIVAIDDLRLTGFADLIAYLFNHKSPNDTVTLKILRNNGGDSFEEIEIEVKLAKRP